MNGNPGSLVKVDLGDGRLVIIEASNVTPERPVGIGDVLRFDGVAASIEAVARRLSDALEKVEPDRASVEFGIDVTVESGTLTGLIAKGGGGATLKVTLEWERRPSDGEKS